MNNETVYTLHFAVSECDAVIVISLCFVHCIRCRIWCEFPWFVYRPQIGQETRIDFRVEIDESVASKWHSVQTGRVDAALWLHRPHQVCAPSLCQLGTDQNH